MFAKLTKICEILSVMVFETSFFQESWCFFIFLIFFIFILFIFPLFYFSLSEAETILRGSSSGDEEVYSEQLNIDNIVTEYGEHAVFVLRLLSEICYQTERDKVRAMVTVWVYGLCAIVVNELRIKLKQRKEKWWKFVISPL